MDANKVRQDDKDSSNGMSNQSNTPWYLKGDLKDWAIIIGLIVFFVTNTASYNEAQKSQISTLASDISEMKTSLKEIQSDFKNNFKEIGDRLNDVEVKIKIMERDLQSNNKQN